MLMIILTNFTHLFFRFLFIIIVLVFFSAVKDKKSSFLSNMSHLNVCYTLQLFTSTENCTITRKLRHIIQKGKFKKLQKLATYVCFIKRHIITYKNKYQCPSTWLHLYLRYPSNWSTVSWTMLVFKQFFYH